MKKYFLGGNRKRQKGSFGGEKNDRICKSYIYRKIKRHKPDI